MSESEKARPRTKTELRRGAEWTVLKPSQGVTTDEEALLLGEGRAPTAPFPEIEPTPPQAA